MSPRPPATARLRSSRLARRQRIAAAIAGLALLVVCAAAFVGWPFDRGFELRAVLPTATQLTDGSEVRTAGVRVGTVTTIRARGDGTALVSMRLDDRALPVHGDLRLTVEPRLVLEGNAYIDLVPGSPGAPILRPGATIPSTQTAVRPQLDQVIDVFDAPVRSALHRGIAELRHGLGDGGTGDRSPAAQGHAALRRAARELNDGLRDATRVARAAQGTRAGDLGRTIRGLRDVSGQLAADPRALADLVTNVDRVSGALAAEDRAVAATLRGFDATLRSARPSLRELTPAFHSLVRLGDALRPALRAAPRPLEQTDGLAAQLEALVRPRELGRVVPALRPTVAALPSLERRLRVMFGAARPVLDCLNSNIVPALNMKIDPGGAYPHATGDPVFLELMHAFTGFSSIGSSVDANGGTIRLGLAGGEQMFEGIVPGLGRAITRMPDEPLGVRPESLGYGQQPPYRPDVPCAGQALPDLNARGGAAPRWKFRPVRPTPRKAGR